jgi:serine protease Do
MSAAGLADDLGRIADSLGRVTVEIRTRGRSLGAGVVWPERRVVVTNAHVVGARSRCLVGFADGRIEDGRVVRVDDRRDLAVVVVSSDGLEAAVVGDPVQLRTGELVLALGHPFGLSRALALGIVHAADRRWIQADVRLAPGFSGGPLADAAGRVVGINAMIAHGLGLAVPATAIERFVRAAAPATEAA